MTGEQIQQSWRKLRCLWRLPLVLALCVTASLAVQAEPADSEGDTPGAAEPAQAPTYVDRPMVRSQRDDQVLARQFPDLAVWLEPEQLPPLLGLYQPGQRAGNPGGILLLGDEGQTANSPLLAVLRERLSKAGWGVLSVGVAEAPVFVSQARLQLSPTEAAPEQPAGVASVMIDVDDSDHGDALARYYRDQGRRLESGFAWLQSQGYQAPVVIAVGWSADLVQQGLQQAMPGDVRLIWVAPRFSKGDQEALVSGLEQARVLDVQPAADRDGAGAARSALFRREEVGGYRRSVVAMAEVPGPVDGPAIAGRILAWLGR